MMKADTLLGSLDTDRAWFPAPGKIALRGMSGRRYADLPSKDTVFEAGVEMLAPCPALSTPDVQNITRSGFTLRWSAASENGIYAGYILRCQPLDCGTIPGSTQAAMHISTAANITGLPPNSTWIVFAAAYDAGGNVVQESPGLTVTTLP